MGREGVPRPLDKEETIVKKLVAMALFGLAGLAAFAGTCTVTHISLVSTDGTHKTFAGQLDNTSGVNILQHNFVVAFIDSSNNLVETKSVSGCLRSVQNNNSDFFSAVSTSSSSGISVGLARIAFDGSFKVGTVSSQDVTISGVTARRLDDELTIRGTVKNNDSDTLHDPVVCIVVRTSGDNVLITVKDTLDDLSEDEEGDFVATVTVPDNDTADSVDVYVDGLDSDDNPTAPEAKLNSAVDECDATPTKTNTPTTPTATNTVAATNTPTQTPTSTPTVTPGGPTLTNTPTNTPTKTNTPNATATNDPC
jgi:hypothetical protein